ncbi:DNA end-binding protein Ku [Streptomyces sp. DvalAA-14]|uniref:non-homologous end joining protein Ku n=1 Tax=unclassified Streptomyces TaxID=2593676 RepID=UPI00081B145C|nr:MULTISPECIES: Ku protein [unclassified Streptomyces]MYS23036.1 Ku protein [Streptomyces sp. SID4948]SCE26413.1 DNA end-binding protein Ku [Streptomyces sp. DvalAA-14]
MRSVWSGNLAFGLVSIPVKLGSAVSSHKIGFRQIHRADQGRVRYQKTCELDEQVLSTADITRAYETADELVEVTDEDLKALPLPTAKTIEISGFLDMAALDPMQVDTPYFLAPASPSAEKPYVLMRDALTRSGKAAVGKFAMRNSEHLALIRPQDDILLLQTLRWPDELNDPAEATPRGNVKISASELRLADTLIEALGEADLSEYHDEYAQAVEALVAAKLEGVEPPAPGAQDTGGKVVDLMSALRASVDQARGGEEPDEESDEEATVHQLRSPGRKKAPAKKSAAGKSAAKKPGSASGAGSESAPSGGSSGGGSKAATPKKTAAKKTAAEAGTKKATAKSAAAKKAPAKKSASRRRTG